VLDFTEFNSKLISPHALETARSLIELYNLHEEPFNAVDVSVLLAQFDLRFIELPDTTFGFTLDMGDKIIIAINQSLDATASRAVAMHEVGHVACWHPNQLNALERGQWIYDQLETEATTVAACLLLPHEGMAKYRRLPAQKIARLYWVPVELVLIRKLIRAVSGF
jgi:Zn-dependent peptidase ImmA (M78 family)